MAENRYNHRESRRRERHKLHRLDREMQLNQEAEARMRRARREQERWDELTRKLKLVIPE